MKTVLKGPRIVLMHLEPSKHNAELLHQVLVKNKKFLLPWLSWARDIKNTPQSVKDRYNYLVKCDEKWDENCAYEYVVVLDDKIIGSCSVIDVDVKNKKAELGYWLAKDYRGNGYVMESVSVLEQALFKNGFNKIIIRNDTLNKGSVNIAKKLGYELEGVLKQDRWISYEKRFRDTNMFAKFKHK